MIIFQIILGWFLADVLSGVLHYILDTKGSPTTPVIGPLVIQHSRIHHDRPLEFTNWGFFARHLNTWVVVAVVVMVWWMIFGLSVVLVTAIIGGMISPSVHYWAHRPSLAPRWVRWLQSVGMFQSPKNHSRHHAPPYRRHYCVLTDWVNNLIK